MNFKVVYSPQHYNITLYSHYNDFSLYLWPCSVFFCEYILYHSVLFKDKKVIELGSGLCLPGLLLKQ